MPKELRYLWLLFWISTISSTGELITAWYFANSASAQADSIHALMHSIWYWVAVYEYRKFGHSIFSSGKDGHAHHQFTWTYAILFFGSLSVVFIEAILKVISPTQIIPHYMLLSVGIGIFGNIISIPIIWLMRPASDTNGRFSQLWLHALADLYISIPVLIYAFILFWIPPNSVLDFIDPILTFAIVIYLGIKAGPLFLKDNDH